MTTSWRPSSFWIKRGNVFNRGEFAELSWESLKLEVDFTTTSGMFMACFNNGSLSQPQI